MQGFATFQAYAGSFRLLNRSQSRALVEGLQLHKVQSASSLFPLSVGSICITTPMSTFNSVYDVSYQSPTPFQEEASLNSQTFASCQIRTSSMLFNCSLSSRPKPRSQKKVSPPTKTGGSRHISRIEPEMQEPTPYSFESCLPSLAAWRLLAGIPKPGPGLVPVQRPGFRV